MSVDRLHKGDTKGNNNNNLLRRLRLVLGTELSARNKIEAIG
jgi:hypothetical protein